jgi:hypothetical protein
LPDVRRRARAASLFALAAAIGITITVTTPSTTEAVKAPPGIVAFMKALGQVESGGRYNARNPSSGAYGKYQIMPYMWRAWARIYFGNANLRPTPTNQERLARAVLTRAYWKFGSWPVVAHYWLTGRAERSRSTWSSFARRYVDKVMTYYKRYGGTNAGGSSGGKPAGSDSRLRTSWVDETTSRLTFRGRWGTAWHGSYTGGKARYATAGGASATFTFNGEAVSWVGPKGPTRGRARVFVDGVFHRTVDLSARGFSPRNLIFSKSWTSGGTHTLRIEVVSTPSRPYVAIDGFLVRVP